MTSIKRAASGWAHFVASVFLVLAAAAGRAEDIDLFLADAAQGAAANDLLLVVDNTENWLREVPAQSGGSPGPLWEHTRAALRELMRAPFLQESRIGLMTFPVGAGTASATGAYSPELAVSRGPEAFTALLREWHVDADTAPAGSLALAFAEAYGFFREQPDKCGENLLVLVSHGTQAPFPAANARAEALLGGHGVNTEDTIGIAPGGFAADFSDEWARFLAAGERAVRSFVIDASGGDDPAWSALLRSIARNSGGAYFDVEDGAGITAALQVVLNRVNDSASSFSTAALPQALRGESLFHNRVFMPYFRPDSLARPRWVGNLKQYRMGYSPGGSLQLQDADGRTLMDASRGAEDFCARSYWTPRTTDDYWAFRGRGAWPGSCEALPGSAASNYPDGPFPEKGGQAYVARGGAGHAGARPESRVLYTTRGAFCGGSTGRDCALLEFTASSGVTGRPPLRHALDAAVVDWARGADVLDEDGDANREEYRPSIHGDVVHSHPLAIDYADDPNQPLLAVFYGANDGLLRAVNGSRNTSHDGVSRGGGVAAGQAYWAFLPPEAVPLLERQFDNREVVRIPASGSAAAAAGKAKDYGPDGALTTLRHAGRRYLFFGLRRGGRGVYGMDITDLEAPGLLWHLGCSTPEGDNSGCAPGWEQMGQSWSAPVPVSVEDAPTPYLLMGGGYAACEDVDDPEPPANHACSASSTGGGIYVLDPLTGHILAFFPTERSVAADVTVVGSSNGGTTLADYAYAADTGGNIYRLSAGAGTPLGSTPPAQWQLTRIAALGCENAVEATCVANRKFLFAPDVVRLPGDARNAVFIGSGDREKPLWEYGGAAAVDNHFYAVVDDTADPDWFSGEASRCGAPLICAASLADGPGELSGPAGKGWQFPLRAREQVVTGALTLADRVHFGTHIPEPRDAADECGRRGPGTATRYQLRYSDGEPASVVEVAGAGLLTTPVAGNVALEDGRIVPFCLGCGGGAGPAGLEEIEPVTRPARAGRAYWRLEQ